MAVIRPITCPSERHRRLAWHCSISGCLKKPNIQLEGAAEMPQMPNADADVLVHCADCDVSVPAKVMQEQDYVCPRCGALQKISARDRMRWLCDAGSFKEMDKDMQPVDRLGFPKYAEKLQKSAESSGRIRRRHYRAVRPSMVCAALCFL